MRFIPWRRKGRRVRRRTSSAFKSNHQRVECQLPDCDEVIEGDDPHDVWHRLSKHVEGHNEQQD